MREPIIKVTPVPLIATKYGGRTIVGIKGQDEAEMWQEDSTLWGEIINPKRIKMCCGETAEEIDRFLGECGTTFASEEAAEQYDAFCEGRLIGFEF